MQILLQVWQPYFKYLQKMSPNFTLKPIALNCVKKDVDR